MYLYLVQHAEAKSKDIDPSRGLSEKGTENLTKVAGYAARMNISVSEIIHSGKKRALESAGILAEHLKPEEVIESDGLSPKDDPEIWHERIGDMHDDIMLVGHLPYMARLSGLLVCGNKDKAAVNFEMGCIVCLKKDDESGWALDWIIKPGMIR
jgi:phosphohistidine phosphatase